MWKWTLLTSSRFPASWKGKERRREGVCERERVRETERERGVEMEGFAFHTKKSEKKKSNEWVTGWMNERRAGAERGSGPVDQQRLTRLLQEDEKGKNGLSFKEEDPLRPGRDQTGWFISERDRERARERESEREREREREEVAFVSIQKLQRKRSIQKCWYARHEDGFGFQFPERGRGSGREGETLTSWMTPTCTLGHAPKTRSYSFSVRTGTRLFGRAQRKRLNKALVCLFFCFVFSLF